MNWGLGTVQFGTPYGISNKTGQTPPEEALRIIERAHAVGFRLLDTAPGYGDSEAVLGSLLTRWPDFRIVTKTLSLRDTDSQSLPEQVKNGLENSLQRLQRKKADVLLLHQPGLLLGKSGPAVVEALQSVKTAGLTKAVGVSVYTASEIDRALELFHPDMVQVPVNLFDQRLLVSGHLERLKRMGIEVVVRSVFLQGLLLMNRRDIPPKLQRWSTHFDYYDQFLAKENLTPLQAALGFVSKLPWVDIALLGACRISELDEILNALATLPKRSIAFESVATQQEELINPMFWGAS